MIVVNKQALYSHIEPLNTQIFIKILSNIWSNKKTYGYIYCIEIKNSIFY